MSTKPFDATLKELIESDPLSWARRFAGANVRAASVVDADISTFTAAADKVLRIEADEGVSLLNVEPESSHAADGADRLLLYGVVLRHRHRLPVRGVLLLLRREANATAASGQLVAQVPGHDRRYLTFDYQVVRLWAEPFAPLLDSGPGTLPLAPLTDEAADDLRFALRQVEERLAAYPAGRRDIIREATFLLLGLRYDENIIQELKQEASMINWEESSTYRMAMRRGAEGEARQTILDQGAIRFGNPDDATRNRVEAITDLTRLRELRVRLLAAGSWQDLLGPE